MTVETLRVLLAVCFIAMYLLAMLCLRQRRLSLREHLTWGILALFIPALGPFLAILHRPTSPISRR